MILTSILGKYAFGQRAIQAVPLKLIFRIQFFDPREETDT
jgi:hypothetical protein